MENPNAHGVRLQKHHSMQSTLRRRSSLLHSQKLPMKSNPYVGSFRHAPPATKTKNSATTTTSSSSSTKPEALSTKPTTTPPVPNHPSTESKLRVPVTLPMKSSPYIGWFRHAPPCTFSCREDMKRHLMKTWWDDRYAKVVDSLPLPRRNDLTLADLLFSGHLKGGGRGESTHRLRTQSHLPQQYQQQQQQVWLEAAAHGVFYAFRIVARLASGFAYDAESMKYLSNEDLHPATSAAGGQDHHQHNKRYHRRSYHHQHDAALHDDNDSQRSDDSSSSSSSSCDDDDANSMETSSLSIPAVLDLPADLDLSSIDLPADLELSVSSLAEAYYAHQAAKDLDLMSHCSYLGQDASGLQFGHHRLDYVITQLDIARMARNASRHLDVESIYNLPTTTYHAKKRHVPCALPAAPAAVSAPLQPQHFQPLHIGRDATEGFSWLIIPAEPRADGPVEDAQPAPPPIEELSDDDEEDVCVICFEHFSEGDRLRVLPCQHSFHMGCIDRWLSGSHSSLDCVTSGCPTCKKRPSVGNYPSEDHHATLNGSVPAWAFAQIGESLAAGSQGIPSATTTTTAIH